MATRSTKATIDHDEIRRWAEARRAKPAIVRDTGIIRLDFPGYSGADKLDAISWDEWFERFEDAELALVFQDETREGRPSNFNKLVGRETIDLETGERAAMPRRRAKAAARKTTPRAAAKRATAKRTTAKRATSKRGAPKRTTAKRGAAKRTTAKRAAPKTRGKGMAPTPRGRRTGTTPRSKSSSATSRATSGARGKAGTSKTKRGTRSRSRA